MSKINFQDDNHQLDPERKDWGAKEWIEELYYFLQGKSPDGVLLGRGNQPKLSKNKAYSIIWYLQEHMRVLPDNIEQCSFCGDLYDSWSTGYYSEKKGKRYCEYCDGRIDDGHNEED